MRQTDEYIAEVDRILDQGTTSLQSVKHATKLNKTAAMMTNRAIHTVIANTWTSKERVRHELLNSLWTRRPSANGLDQLILDIRTVISDGPRNLSEKALYIIAEHLGRAERVVEQGRRIARINSMHIQSE